MKKKALVAAVLAATTLSATPAFAETNPFTDVPADHWSYEALAMLAKDGVLEGYGDGTFQGDNLMNRYEMAEVVARAAEKYGTAAPRDKGAINDLEKEYAQELKDMEVRLAKAENEVAHMKKMQSTFKMWGDARMRFIANKNGKAVKAVRGNTDTTTSTYNQWNTKNNSELRLRLGFYGEPAPNLSVNGRLKVENGNIAREDYDSGHDAGKGDEKMNLDKLQLDWHAKNGFTVSAGRNELSLGQGLIYWENPVDGLMVQKDFGDKIHLMAGLGDTSCATWTNNAGLATFANLSAKVSPAVTVTAAYFNQHSDTAKWTDAFASWDGGKSWFKKGVTTTFDFRQLALGVHAQLADKWSLIAEGVKNSADPNQKYDATGNFISSNDKHDKGFWTRLTYGKQDWSKANTWQLYGEYFSFGGLAIDSTGWPHRLNIAGGNGYGGQGARGYGLGVSYMVANNTNLDVTYYKMKPYDRNLACFDDYEDMGYAALTYSF